VKREIAIADRAHVPIFWVRLERIAPQKLGYFLNTTQWIDWLDERDVTLDELIVALGRPTVANDLHEQSLSDEPPKPLTPLLGWPRAIAAFDNENVAAQAAAHVLYRQAIASPDGSVILPTGRTASTLFRGMIKVAPNYAPAPLGESMVLSDTETFGVHPKHDTSRTRHVMEGLIDRLAAKGLAPAPEQIQLLSGLVLEEDPFRRTQLLLRDYPPTVHAVSLAPTGEVLGYEVGTYTDPEEIVNDHCHVIELSEPGRRYVDPQQPSRSVVTIGLGAALTSRMLLILAFDHSKSRILHQITWFPETAGIPASLLRRHPSVGIVTTRALVEAAQLRSSQAFPDAETGAEWLLEVLG
jgi:6-phosphogluconolactonase/glucosamine-6-phosphate isomerase/deaminase